MYRELKIIIIIIRFVYRQYVLKDQWH